MGCGRWLGVLLSQHAFVMVHHCMLHARGVCVCVCVCVLRAFVAGPSVVGKGEGLHEFGGHEE